eukprot:g24669.t1
MTRICGILLVPMDKERAMLAGSLARSALELGHPKVRTFGIDPYKRANKCLLLFYALIYMGSRGVTKFIIKLIVKKAAPRTLLKVTEFAPLAVEVFINVVFNSVTVNYAMNEVMICSLGPSATVEVTSQLIKAHRRSKNVEEPLSDELKLLALRAVGVSITYKMQLHPNSRFLLNHVVGLFADQTFVKRAKEDYGHSCGVQRTKSRVSQRSHRSTQSKQRRRCCGCRSSPASADPTETLHEELADLGLDEEDLFFDGLTGLNHRDALFACSMLVLALMLDGRIGRQDWAFIQRAAGSARFALDLLALLEGDFLQLESTTEALSATCEAAALAAPLEEIGDSLRRMAGMLDTAKAAREACASMPQELLVELLALLVEQTPSR